LVHYSPSSNASNCMCQRPRIPLGWHQQVNHNFATPWILANSYPWTSRSLSSGSLSIPRSGLMWQILRWTQLMIQLIPKPFNFHRPVGSQLLSNLESEAELQKVLHGNRPTTEVHKLIPCNSPFAPLTLPPSFAGVCSEPSICLHMGTVPICTIHHCHAVLHHLVCRSSTDQPHQPCLTSTDGLTHLWILHHNRFPIVWDCRCTGVAAGKRAKD